MWQVFSDATIFSNRYDQAIHFRFDRKTFHVILLAAWGAFLSTMLAGVKLWELYQQRARLIVSYSFSSPENGNDIILYNPTNVPVLINYWELLWIKKKLFHRSQLTAGEFPDEGLCDIVIPAHSRYVLSFQEHRYFDWHVGKAGGGNIYIRLHVVGRRPVLKEVYRYAPFAA